MSITAERKQTLIGEYAVKPGDTLVLIGIGPAIGMPETYQVTSALKYRNTSRTIGMVNGTWSLAEAANACIPEQSGATSEMRAEMVAS